MTAQSGINYCTSFHQIQSCCFSFDIAEHLKSRSVGLFEITDPRFVSLPFFSFTVQINNNKYSTTHVGRPVRLRSFQISYLDNLINVIIPGRFSQEILSPATNVEIKFCRSKTENYWRSGKRCCTWLLTFIKRKLQTLPAIGLTAIV